MQYVQVENDIVIANMIGQHGIKTFGYNKPIRYEAIEKCLEKVSIVCKNNNATIHMPRIGCGLAGGEWEKIEKMYNKIKTIFNGG